MDFSDCNCSKCPIIEKFFVGLSPVRHLFFQKFLEKNGFELVAVSCKVGGFRRRKSA